MKARCRIEIEFPDPEAAAKAVAHEGGLSERSSAKIEISGKKLILSVEAKDVVALRATVNAYMRAFQVFEGIEEKSDG
jgi:tRNA threonylcarbamoyladenosine modification (KEOPS) complex  Pcc1 subunit